MGRSSSIDTGKSSWFWGVVLSLSLHGAILLLALFWGFGAPKYTGEPQTIEGRLVSLSEVERIGGGRVEPAPVEKKERAPQTKKEEPEKVEVKKKEEPPEVKEKKVAITKPEKAEVKKEEPPEVKEEPKKKDTVVLDSKEKKEKKKEIAKKPEPTPPPKAASQKEPPRKKEPGFEEIRKGVLEDMQKSVADKQRRSVIEDIEKNVQEEKQVAEVDSSEREETNSNYQTDRSGSGAATGVVTSLFIERIREEIKSKWTLPQSFSIDEGLRTVVVFKIDERGKPYDVIVDKSSGNKAFDDFCVKAVYKAAPLTPPPPELLEVAKTEGVEVTFEP